MTQATDQTGQEEGLAGQASAKMQDAASVAQEKASQLREQGSARLRDQFDERSTQAGTQVRSLAEALRRSGNDLSNDGNGNAAQLTGQAADRIERVGNYLEQKSGDELMRDIESFARRRPWMLAGIGMLAGLAAARFMKASSEQRYDSYRQTNGQWPRRSGAASSSGSPDGQGELAVGGLVDQPASVGSDVPGALGDDAPARDPYAGGR
jgi:ElaB/YqjD/DUF883 family membrane-anchored ribosome-binding protein